MLYLYIKEIKLINFRNYDLLDIRLNEKMNIFIGKNAQGKTNLLESVYLCGTGTSFRTNRDSELINFHKSQAYVGLSMNSNGRDRSIEVKLDKNRPKRIKINKIELENLRELDSGLNIVVFSPEDLKIVKDGPYERRRFLDSSISQIRPLYRYNLNRYNKILYQRNNLLKSNKSNSDIINLIDIFDIQMAKVGTDIILSRREFLKKLSNQVYLIHRNLTSQEEGLRLGYISNLDTNKNSKEKIEEEFLGRLRANIKRDLLVGNTEIGPHRDDIDIRLNSLDSRIYASQGQQRTIVLSIKLSHVELIHIETGKYPVLLLDDVFSELDEERRGYLSRSFNKMQTMITSTDLLGLEELMDMEKSIFHIDNGKIIGKG